MTIIIIIVIIIYKMHDQPRSYYIYGIYFTDLQIIKHTATREISTASDDTYIIAQLLHEISYTYTFWSIYKNQSYNICTLTHDILNLFRYLKSHLKSLVYNNRSSGST